VGPRAVLDAVVKRFTINVKKINVFDTVVREGWGPKVLDYVCKYNTCLVFSPSLSCNKMQFSILSQLSLVYVSLQQFCCTVHLL
jgi:hypothetical protein